MENDFEQLVTALSDSPLSIDICNQITQYLQRQTNDLLPSFISQSLQSLIILERWAWKLFCQGFHQLNYPDLFQSLGSFNFMLIFNTNQIDPNVKSALLIPEKIEWIDQIFAQLENINDDNDSYLVVISRWFDNLSYFIHEHTQFETLPTIVHIWHNIGLRYIVSDQFRFYLTQLNQPNLSQSLFTARQLFYLRTCPFMFRMYICSVADKHSFKGDELLTRYVGDYFKLIEIHSHTVDCWSKELLTCITHLIDFICACCWWGRDKAIYTDKLVLSEPIFFQHIEALIRIVGYKPFHERIAAQWHNDETILIDSTFIFFIGALLQIKNLSCFIRSETNLSNIILAIAQKSCYDRISLCAYGILAEILSDEQLREVKITDNISEFFFRILELAWSRPTQCYKRIHIPQLLRGFLTVSKNDAIQQRTANSNKIPLLITMSDQYPITLDILWSLSFNSDIQQQLRSNRSFMNKLARLEEGCNDEKMRKIIFGILWNLEIHHQDRAVSDTTAFDIMISYSHKDETICKQIYEELVKSGYKVWIDYDQIHGNVMDAMAQAIERSNTIIICMSEQYRRSNYCRAEAHYAFQRQLKIVPILLQEHYKPDGWLLFLIGQLLYVDFTIYEFPRAIELLIKELKAPDIQETQPVAINSKQDKRLSTQSLSELSKLPLNILEWTENDVQNWLLSYNLQQMTRLLVDFNGKNLISLNEFIRKNDSQQVLILLQEDCMRRINEKISLLELARFRTLLNEKHESIEVNRLSKKGIKALNLLSHCQIL